MIVRALAVYGLLLLNLNATAAEFEIHYTGDYWRNASGGLNEGNRYLDNIDVQASGAVNVPGLGAGQWSAWFIYTNSNTLSAPLIGDFQGVSNIDNTTMNRVYELWYEAPVGEAQTIRFGLLDVNAEFDAIEPAGLFINSSHGIGPDFAQSGANGPSIFPVTSLGLRYEHGWQNGWLVRGAVLDAVPGDAKDFRRNTIKLSEHEGALMVSEVTKTSETSRFGVGSWYYTRSSDRLDSTGRDQNLGMYAFVHGQNWWLRIGSADSDLNEVSTYLGAGVVWQPGESETSTLGLALAHARASSNAGYAKDHETTLELTWRREVLPGLALQPDVQYVINPGFDKNLDHALVFGVRMQWSFGLRL